MGWVARRFGLAWLTVVGLPGAWAAGNSYLDALPEFWSRVYPQGGETLYCGEAFGQRKGRRINAEHVFPMAWVMNAFGCTEREQCRRQHARFNRIESDFHNLYPARRDINKARSSYSFGEIAGEERAYGRCDFEVDHRRRLAEPRPASRGEIARAMFYMRETYGLAVFPRLGRLLLEWHRQDPPSAEERRRNDAIELAQGTRNRFIDRPEAASGLDFQDLRP
jgi:deoxyribonuclease-1